MPARSHFSPWLLALALAGSARADGQPVGPVPGDAQCRPAVTSDGRGGALVSYKTSALNVGAVHVNASGQPDGGIGFAPVAVPLGIEISEPVRLSLPSDTQVVLVTDRGTASGPALTSLRSGGSATRGFPVALLLAHRHPAIVRGTGGRTLIVSKNSDAVTFWSLRVAIVKADGHVETSLQLPSPLQFFSGDHLDAVSDGAGGLIAAFPYYDATSSGSKDIAVFRLAADGSRPWGDTPRYMIFAANDQTDPRLAPDGAGGAIMVWTDPREVSRDSDIYALHITASGDRSPGWAYFGQPVCDAPGAQSQPRIVSDGASPASGGAGAWVVWLDYRAGAQGDLRISHVLGDGSLAPGFNSSGTSLCGAAGAQGEVDLAGDGDGGVFVVWRDDRNGNADIFSQHVLANGAISPGWPVNGRALTTAAGAQDQPAIASVSGGRAVVAWRDGRGGTPRIYATAILDPATTDSPLFGGPELWLAAETPARSDVRVRLTLPGTGPALLELLDVSGRVRARAETMGPVFDWTVALSPARALEQGLYFVRVRQGSASACARVTLLR